MPAPLLAAGLALLVLSQAGWCQAQPSRGLLQQVAFPCIDGSTVAVGSSGSLSVTPQLGAVAPTNCTWVVEQADYVASLRVSSIQCLPGVAWVGASLLEC